MLGVREVDVYTMKGGNNKGKKITISSLTVQDFSRIEKEALRTFKRRFIETYTDNIDLVPDQSKRDQIVQVAMDKAAKIDVQDLPLRKMRIPDYQRNGKGKPKLVGTKLQEVDYTLQWMSETVDGKLFSAWLSIIACKGQEGMTLEDADALFMDSAPDLEEAAQIIGGMSQPKVLVEDEEDEENFTVRKESRRKNREQRRRKREQRKRKGD